MRRARPSLGPLLAALGGTIVAVWVSGCRSTLDGVKLPPRTVALSLKSGTEGYPILFKKQNNRLAWSASDALRIRVHVDQNPVPFEGMTAAGSEGPCVKGGDCLIRCPVNQTVCISGKIAISKDDFEKSPEGYRYEYEFTLVRAGKASADPGFIIKP